MSLVSQRISGSHIISFTLISFFKKLQWQESHPFKAEQTQIPVAHYTLIPGSVIANRLIFLVGKPF